MHFRLPRPILYFLFLLAALPASARTTPEPDLLIAHTNDLHARYRPFESRGGESRGGFARISGRLNQLRVQYGDRLLFVDAGDLFQGTPFYHFYRGQLGMDLLDAMKCDAFVLGNHELDDGHENFLLRSKNIAFPTLCANVSLPEHRLLMQASTRIETAGLSIDIVGLVTAGLDEVTGVVSRGELVLEDPAQALGSWMDARTNAADFTFVLSHCGLGEDLQIAAEVAGIPLIIGGHSHSFMDEPELVGETTVTSAGAYGYNLGLLKLWRNEDGSWRIESEMLPINSSSPEDPIILAMIDKAAVIVDQEMDIVVGSLAGDFDARGKSSAANPLGQWIAELTRLEAGADIGLQNIGGYRTSFREGPLTRGDIFTLLPFDNRIVRLTFGGDTLLKFFDYLASCHGGGRFGQISGATYRVEEGKAKDIVIAGLPFDSGRDYTLATNDFLLGGGDGYTVLKKAKKVEILEAFPRDVMESWLRAGNIPSPSDYQPNVISSDEN